ncbi:TolC family protein [Sphingomonas ginsenosidivorax]|nr:TolC family protein [Sphingomonas ginsenosidivorax]
MTTIFGAILPPQPKQRLRGGGDEMSTERRAFCLLVSSVALCGAAPHQPYRLAEMVYAANPRIQAQREVVQQARARLDAARSGSLPSIEGDALVQRRRLGVVNGPGDQTFTLGQASLEARMPLFDGGRTGAAKATARAELDNAEAVLNDTVEQVMLDLVTALADTRSAAEVEGFVQQQNASLQSELAMTERRLSVRDATLTDISQAQARLATSEAGMLDAQTQRAASRSRLEELLGAPIADETMALPQIAAGPPTIEDAKQHAIRNSPVLRAARAAVAAGRGAVSAARAQLAPNVEAVVGVDYLTGGVANLFTGQLPNDRTATFGGVSAHVPIFQRGAEYAEIRRAKGLEAQRMFQLAQVEREVVRDVEVTWTRRQAAARIVAIAGKAVVANESAVSAITREATFGERTTIDVLDAQRDLLTARIDQTRAARAEIVAQATLLAEIGSLAQTLLGSAPPNRP